MVKEYLETGKITSTHGIKGEMRVQPWCDSPEFMKKFRVLYLDRKGEKHLKVKIRPNGNMALIGAMITKNGKSKIVLQAEDIDIQGSMFLSGYLHKR